MAETEAGVAAFRAYRDVEVMEMAHSVDLPELGPDAPADEVCSAVEFQIRELIQQSGDFVLDEDYNWSLTIECHRLVAVCGNRKIMIRMSEDT